MKVQHLFDTPKSISTTNLFFLLSNCKIEIDELKVVLDIATKSIDYRNHIVKDYSYGQLKLEQMLWAGEDLLWSLWYYERKEPPFKKTISINYLQNFLTEVVKTFKNTPEVKLTALEKLRLLLLVRVDLTSKN